MIRFLFAITLAVVSNAIGMIAAVPQPAKKQLLFGVKSRFEVNPSFGGYLQSNFTAPADLGRRIEKNVDGIALIAGALAAGGIALWITGVAAMVAGVLLFATGKRL